MAVVDSAAWRSAAIPAPDDVRSMPASFSHAGISAGPLVAGSPESRREPPVRRPAASSGEAQPLRQARSAKAPRGGPDQQIDDDGHARRNADEQPGVEQSAGRDLADL